MEKVKPLLNYPLPSGYRFSMPGPQIKLNNLFIFHFFCAIFQIMKKQEEIREKILDAAYERFSRYGFGKTTVTEIAGDCSMSASNLYRYFENKNDIGAGVVIRFTECEEKLIREEIRQPGLDAAKRLESLVVVILRYIYNEFASRPHILELVDFVIKERYDLAEKHDDMLVSLITEVLALGNASDEFNVTDVVAMADTIKMAVVSFTDPAIIGISMECSKHNDCYKLENMERMAKKVVRLLVDGLKKR